MTDDRRPLLQGDPQPLSGLKPRLGKVGFVSASLRDQLDRLLGRARDSHYAASVASAELTHLVRAASPGLDSCNGIVKDIDKLYLCERTDLVSAFGSHDITITRKTQASRVVLRHIFAHAAGDRNGNLTCTPCIRITVNNDERNGKRETHTCQSKNVAGTHLAAHHLAATLKTLSDPIAITSNRLICLDEGDITRAGRTDGATVTAANWDIGHSWLNCQVATKWLRSVVAHADH